VKEKGIFDVLDANFLRLKNDPDHIEPEGVTGPLEARYPDFGRSTQLALLSPVDRAHRSTEIVRRTRLYFDERDGPAGALALRSGRDQVDVATAIPEAPLGDLPTVNREPSLRDSFAFASHDLPRCRHAGNVEALPAGSPSLGCDRKRSFACSLVTSRHLIALALVCLSAASLRAQMPLTADQTEAREIFKEMIEINSSYKGGSTTPVAHAVARRFLAAGFPASDVRVLGPTGDKDSSVVVRMEGTSKSIKPILLIAHIDVVEALRSDWSLDPYKLTEQDGFFYGRGTSDIKDGAATLVEALLRLKRNQVVPRRTLILALTAGEEGGGGYNGMDWLLKNHRDLMDAAFALNVDSGDPVIQNGKRLLRGVQTSEKLYQSFSLEVTNKGGHSSLPTPDNAITQLSDAIGRVSRFQFPVRLTETTRVFFERLADIQSGQVASDMRAISKDAHDSAAAARLSISPTFNAQLRTTCVPTMIEGGHAPNALPQRARAVVNCRIMPGESATQIRTELIRVVADDSVHVTPINDGSAIPASPSPLVPEVMAPVEKITRRLWPGVPVIPQMETGATDGAYLRAAGIPTYGVSGVFIDIDDIRAHGRDERIIVRSFYDGVEYIYQLVKEVAAGTR
jgi:acetylornithine deacetylase/succinyl-diaminopimelate desuccinylase-like protein